MIVHRFDLRAYDITTIPSTHPFLNLTSTLLFIRPIWIIIFPRITLDCLYLTGFFPFPLDIHFYRLLPGFHNFTDLARTANTLLISCVRFFFSAMYQYSGLAALFAKDYILRRWKAFVLYLMLHIHVGCGCGKLSRKKYPYYIAVGCGVGQAPSSLVRMVYFMYDSFPFHIFFYAGSVFQMFRAQVKWLLGCHCHRQAGECIPVVRTSIQYHIA